MGKSDSVEFELVELLGHLKDLSPDGNGWTKDVMRCRWGNNPTTLDIRNVGYKDGTSRVSKGVCLSDEEADRLVSILLDAGYGSMEELENAIRKKREIFTLQLPEDNTDGPLYIDIP